MLQDRATSTDALLGGRIKIEQPVKGYRSGIDPVLLAAAVPAIAGARALELGIGAGAAAFCLLARVSGIHVTGIESDPQFASLARRNAALNGMEECLKIVEGKISDELDLNPFDHVFANPPYHDTERHDEERGASHMASGELTAWIRYAFRHLKNSGTFTLINRADALAKILGALEALPAGAIKILPIVPHAGESAKRIIVSAVKGRKTPLEILSPLTLHKAGGGYEDFCNSILKDGAALPLN